MITDARVRPKDSLLRLALRADGICSAAAGAAIVATADPLVRSTGVPQSVAYAVGAGFVIFGLTLLALAWWPRIRAAGTGVAIANAAGTVIALVVAATAAPPLTAVGVAGVSAIGLYTAVAAAVQYLGARRLT